MVGEQTKLNIQNQFRPHFRALEKLIKSTRSFYDYTDTLVENFPKPISQEVLENCKDNSTDKQQTETEIQSIESIKQQYAVEANIGALQFIPVIFETERLKAASKLEAEQKAAKEMAEQLEKEAEDESFTSDEEEAQEKHGSFYDQSFAKKEKEAKKKREEELALEALKALERSKSDPDKAFSGKFEKVTPEKPDKTPQEKKPKQEQSKSLER